MKNSLKEPQEWKAGRVDELVKILNDIDIPEDKIQEIQNYLNAIASSISDLVESSWGDDI